MSSLQAIIVQQNNSEDNLNIAFSNFSVKPRDRLARLDRLNSWVEKISKPWMLIKKNHKILLKEHKKEEVRAYLKKFRYDSIEKKVQDTLEYINKLIENAQRKAATTQIYTERKLSTTTQMIIVEIKVVQQSTKMRRMNLMNLGIEQTMELEAKR